VRDIARTCQGKKPEKIEENTQKTQQNLQEIQPYINQTTNSLQDVQAMSLPHGGGLFGIGGSLSFRKPKRFLTSHKNKEEPATAVNPHITTVSTYGGDGGGESEREWTSINSRKIQQLTEKGEMSRVNRNKSYSSSINLILNRGDDQDKKPDRVKRSNTTLGLTGAGGRYSASNLSTSNSFLSKRSSLADSGFGSSSVLERSTSFIRSKPVERHVNKRGSSVNFGSQFLLDSNVFLKDSDSDEDDVAPLTTTHRRPTSTVLTSTSSYTNGENGTSKEPPLVQSFRRSASFHQTMRESSYDPNSSSNTNAASTTTTNGFGSDANESFRSGSDMSKTSTKTTDAIKEANEKRQALVDHVLSYKKKAESMEARRPSLRESIAEIEQDVKARFNSSARFTSSTTEEEEETPKKPFKSRFLNTENHEDGTPKKFQSRFLRQVQGYDDEDWSEQEWRRFIDAQVLVDMAVEVVVLHGRNPKPNFFYESDTPVPLPYNEDPCTVIVSQPPTPRDKYGRKKRDKGGEVRDHETYPVVPETDSPKLQRRWRSWGSRNNISNPKDYDSRRHSIELRRRSICSDGGGSRPVSNVFDDLEGKIKEEEEEEEEASKKVTTTVTCVMRCREGRQQSTLAPPRYSRLATY